MRTTRRGYYTIAGPDGELLTRPDGDLLRVTSRDECYERITEDGRMGEFRIFCPDRVVTVEDDVGIMVGTPPTVGASDGLFWPAQDSVTYAGRNLPAVRDRNPSGETAAPGRGFGMGTEHAYTDWDIVNQTGTAPTILHIDTLADTGNTDATHGSIGWALAQSGPRIIVFDIAGKFVCDSGNWDYGNGKCWVAGQSAPGPVWFDDSNSSGFALRMTTDDVLFQHCHFWVSSVVSLANSKGVVVTTGASNMIFDHCFIGGATDQCFDFLRGSNHTLIDSMVALARGDTTHNHAYGGLWEAEGPISSIGTVFAFNSQRNPIIQTQSGQATDVTICNHLIYQCDQVGVAVYGVGTPVVRMNLEGFRAISSGATDGEFVLYDIGGQSTKISTSSEVYLADNQTPDYVSDEWDIVTDTGNQEADVKSLSRVTAAWPTGLVPADNRSYSQADYITLMTRNCGPRPNDRLTFVQDVIDDIVGNTGSIQDDYASPTISTTNTAWTFGGTPGDEHKQSGSTGRAEVEVQLLDEAQALLNTS